MDNNTIIKICSCGEQYTADQFNNLPYPCSGRDTMIYEYKGKVNVDVYRNCICGSTIVISTVLVK